MIEPGNAYLAGCGLLGELACDGSRAVGLFWSAALGWPLVWDRDEETAIQSPSGGTKTAWGGSTDVPAAARTRHRSVLGAAGDPGAEVERLVGLGATRTSALLASGDDVVLADPDGHPFVLSAS